MGNLEYTPQVSNAFHWHMASFCYFGCAGPDSHVFTWMTLFDIWRNCIVVIHIIGHHLRLWKNIKDQTKWYDKWCFIG